MQSKIVTALQAPAQIFKRLRYNLERPSRDEANCRFVSSRGIAKALRPIVSLSKSAAPQVNPDLFKGVPDDTALYLYTATLSDFVTNYLPAIARPFSLVSGADDHSVSFSTMPAEIESLLGHPMLTRWFAQNLEVSHPKLTSIPIGIDYHTLAGNQDRPWRKFKSPLDQEVELLDVRATAPRVEERSCRAYSNWHFFLERGDRRECFDRIDWSAVFFEPEFVSRHLSWSNNATHLFTVSPFGNGLDCHRTWEALVLGTIPIVHTSKLDALYDGLPVCIVEDWAEVNVTYLRKKRDEFLGREFDYSKLYANYWKTLIRGHAELTANLSIQAFVDER